jgi:predicted acyltransferase
VKAAAHRLESLDVFRGATIAAMILVNNPGDWTAVFAPLLHAYWIGCTFADLVFPWFVFIMGVAMPFAFARRHERGDRTSQVFGRVAQRVLLLIGLGLALTAVASWPAVAALRFPGVLQRIALSYLLAALIVWTFDVRGWMTAIAVLLLGHWALLAFVPFGGFPGGTLTPEHNLARYLDTLVFGRHALTIPNDPEGLLGTLPAAATALIGAVAGELMRRAADDLARLRTLIMFGAAAFVAGIAWSFALPLSKPLWTGSYVLVVTGLGMLVLALIYFLVDVRGLRTWARPFLWLGVNPLAIYVCSEVIGHFLERLWLVQGSGRTTPKAWLFWRYIEPAFHRWPTAWASFAFGMSYAALWVMVAGVLYNRRIHVQV